MATKKGARSKDPGLEEVLRRIDAGQHDPVYLFHGANVHLIEQVVDRLKAAVVGDEDDEFGYQVMRGDEVSGTQVVNAARTVPMLATEQLIVLRGLDALKADDQAALLPYLKDPNPATCLVMIAAKVDKRLKLFAQANKAGVLHEAGAITERELGGWILARGRALGLTLSPQVAHGLGEATGTDPATIEDALERLSLYCRDAKEVTADDVEAVVTSSRVHSIFELTDAIGRRDVASALKVLTNMFENREAPLRILATLATHVRRLLHAAELGPAALNQPNRLAAELGLPPFLARKVADQARQFSRGELRRAVQRLAATDLELKSARRPDELIMEEMLLELCRGRPRFGRDVRRSAARR